MSGAVLPIPATMRTAPQRDAQHQQQPPTRRRQNLHRCAIAIGGALVISAALLFPATFQTNLGKQEEAAGPFLLPVFVICLVMGLFLISCVLCSRHILLMGAAGYDSACFDCIDLREPADPWDPHSLTHLRSVASLPDAQSMRIELRVLTALADIPVVAWSTRPGEEVPDCALCMQELADGASVRKLRCGHCFHTKCIDHWLFRVQRGKQRRCPMCNANPLAGACVSPASPGTGTASVASTNQDESPSRPGSPTPSQPHTLASTPASPAQASPSSEAAEGAAHPYPSSESSARGRPAPWRWGSPRSPAWDARRQWAWRVLTGMPPPERAEQPTELMPPTTSV